MSQQSGSPGGALPVGSMALALAVIGGVMWFDSPLESHRPHEETPFVRETFEEEDVPARMWQDPFRPVHEKRAQQKHQQKGTSDHHRTHSLPRLASEIAWRYFRKLDEKRGSGEVSIATIADDSPELLLMPVMVPGSSHIEDAETRRRTRQAVVSALAAQGYVSESADRIGYVETRWRRHDRRLLAELSETPDGDFETAAGSDAGSETVDVPVPYEWFQRDSLRSRDIMRESDWVLVMWLEEQAFQTAALDQLGQLTSQLLRQLAVLYEQYLFRHARQNPPVREGASQAGQKPPRPTETLSDTATLLFDQLKSETLQFLTRPDAPNAISLDGSERKQVLEKMRMLVAKQVTSHVKLRLIGPSSSATLFNLLRKSASYHADPVTRGLRYSDDAKLEELNRLYDILLYETPSFLLVQLPGVVNSDERWAQTIVEEWVRQDQSTGNALFNVLGNDSRAISDQANLLLDAVGSYLDYGWPVDVEKPRVTAELQRFLSSRISAAVKGRRQIIDSAMVLKTLEIYSNRSTAAEPLLLRQYFADSDKKSIQKIIRDAYEGTHFVSTVARDDELAAGICQELKRRGVDLKGDRDHIVLISEWDSFYGRALPFAIEATIQYLRGKDSADWSTDGTLKLMLEGDVKTPPGVHRFSYLKGLDGSTPFHADLSGTGSAGGGSETPTGDFTPEDWAKPVGRSSLDYIRRVAVQLTHLEDRLADDGERLSAIGVLGGDIYDKLLVLQALRHRFPNVIFFTTDLDARMAHPAEYQFTRNLIIASSYGLRLHRDLQQNVPSFRDSYQTATYMAGLLALGPVTVEVTDLGEDAYCHSDRILGEEVDEQNITLTRNSDLQRYLRPQIFEIARSDAYNITPLADASAIHPAPRIGRPSGPLVLRLLAIGAMAFLLLIPMCSPLRRVVTARSSMNPGDRPAVNRFLILAFLAVSAFLTAIYLDGQDGTGEPFEIAEGISIWPTEACRLLAILMSCVAIARGVRGIRTSDADIERDYIHAGNVEVQDPVGFWAYWQKLREQMLQEDPLTKNISAPVEWTWWQRFRAEYGCLWATRKKYSINYWADSKSTSTAAAEDATETRMLSRIWRKQRELGTGGSQLVRLLPLTVVYTLFGLALSTLLDPSRVPFRGSMAELVDDILAPLSLFLLTLLTFFVVDSTRLCEQFIRRLAATESEVAGTPMLARISKQRGLELQDLSELVDMFIIANRTECVGRLIMYPFLVLGIFIVSRIQYFDYWIVSSFIVVYLGILLLYAVICAVVLRRASEEQRSNALRRLRHEISVSVKSGTAKATGRARQLLSLIHI